MFYLTEQTLLQQLWATPQRVSYLREQSNFPIGTTELKMASNWLSFDIPGYLPFAQESSANHLQLSFREWNPVNIITPCLYSSATRPMLYQWDLSIPKVLWTRSGQVLLYQEGEFLILEIRAERYTALSLFLPVSGSLLSSSNKATHCQWWVWYNYSLSY